MLPCSTHKREERTRIRCGKLTPAAPILGGIDIKTVKIGAQDIPAVGQGTWMLGTDPSQRTKEVDALRYGIEVGLTLIDTAEMYAQGESEKVVGDAVSDLHNRVFLVTKAWPDHHGAAALPRALEKSLERLRVPAVDLYLLHWPSRQYPISETIPALATLYQAGLARHIGVSNFPTPQFREAQALLGDGVLLAADQVEYHLLNRRAETALIPYAMAHQVAVMAYSPLKDLFALKPSRSPYTTLARIAKSRRVTPETIALAYLIGSGPVIAIPKAVEKAHMDANRAALEVALTDPERTELQTAFTSPREELPLEEL